MLNVQSVISSAFGVCLRVPDEVLVLEFITIHFGSSVWE